MERNPPRLIDIADRASVSVTSVSRILAGKRLSEYSEKTRAKVTAIADELGWRPNLVVHGMKTGQTHTVGVFMAPFDTFWMGVLYGIHDTLLDHKRVPVVLWPHALVRPSVDPIFEEAWSTGEPAGTPAAPGVAQSPRRELERLHSLEDRRVDAILCWPLREQPAIERLTKLSKGGWRVVCIDEELLPPHGAAVVRTDEEAAMAEIREHLAGLGHRRVAFVGSAAGVSWQEKRIEAFRSVFGSRGPLLRAGHDDRRMRPEVDGFLAANPDVTAVVAATDHVARQVIRAAGDRDQPVPERLSVVGFGNDASNAASPALTTVDQRPYQIGQTAARIAVARDFPAGGSLTRIRARLVPRASTAVASSVAGR